MPKIGVIVGRFQIDELHPGHLEFFDKVNKQNSKVIVFLGVAALAFTQRNPLDLFARKVMIQKEFPKALVVPLPDYSTDEQWSLELDKRIEELAPIGQITLYGGRDSFLSHYKGKHTTEYVEPEIFKDYSATEIREKIGNIVEDSKSFRAGIIYATQNRYPQIFPCVDVAILNGPFFEGKITRILSKTSVLLARKTGESLFRFVGGHVNASDTSLEHAARREVSEETGLAIEPEYIGSTFIEDWKTDKDSDKILTAFFVGQLMYGAAIARDDIAEVRWFGYDKLTEDSFVSEHKKLFIMLKRHYEGMYYGKSFTPNG